MPPKGKKKKKTKAELEAERLEQEEAERLAREEEERRLEEERKRLEEEARQLKERQLKHRMEELALLHEEIEEYGGEVAARHQLLAETEKRAAEAAEWGAFLACDPLPRAEDAVGLATFLARTAALALDQADACELGAAEAAAAGAGAGADDFVRRALALGARCLAVRGRCAAAAADLLARGDRGLAAKQEDFARRADQVHLDKIDAATVTILRRPEDHDTGDEKKGIMALRELGPVRFAVWVHQAAEDAGRGVQRFRTLDFTRVGMLVDVPKPVQQQERIAVRALCFPHDPAAPPEGEDEAAPCRSLGGVFFLHLLEVPPKSKNIRIQSHKWELRLSTQSQLTSLDHRVYPLDGSSSIAIPPFRCQYQAPPSIIVPEDPVVAWWDPAARAWSTEMATDSEVKSFGATHTGFNASMAGDAAEGGGEEPPPMIKFNALRVGAFALIQDKTVDFPYKQWSLAPSFDLHKTPNPDDWIEEAVLKIETQRFAVEIEVRGHLCRLRGPDLPPLRPLMAEPGLPAGHLLRLLRDAGINLLPTDADAARVRFPDPDEEAGAPKGPSAAPTAAAAEAEGGAGQEGEGEGGAGEEPAGGAAGGGVPLVKKSAALELKMCEEVSSLAASFDFRSSKWSRSRGAAQAVFQMRETSVFTGNNLEVLDYATCLMEEDAASESQANAPGAHADPEGPGPLPAPGIKCSFVRATEAAQTFRADPAPGARTQVYLYNALKDAVSPEAVQRVDGANVRFQRAVHQLLYLTRPFSFA